MSIFPQSSHVRVECPFCHARFCQSLQQLVRDQGIICPNCASFEELDSQETAIIITVATSHVNSGKALRDDCDSNAA